MAAAFDEVLGYVQSLSGNPGMTGALTIKYRRPTLLHKELFFEGETARVSGRKILAEGRVTADGVLTAETEGLFISVEKERMEALMAKRIVMEKKLTQ